MGAPSLTPGLSNLRSQVNARFPRRDTTTDGWLGDEAHRRRTSGHNPDDTAGSKPSWDSDLDHVSDVRAWDMDADLREPGTSSLDVVRHIIALPGLSTVIRYVIHKGGMYHYRDGYARTAYTGNNNHDHHIHFEGQWTEAADRNTSYDYRLEEVGDMGLTPDDRKWIDERVGDSALIFKIDNGKVIQVPADDPNPRQWLKSAASYTQRDVLNTLLAVQQLAEKVDALAAKIDAGKG